MSDLKQLEQEHEANALRINAGRKPKFGDLMRNPWASDGNPQRDGYFVRERRQSGAFNPGHYYEFTNKCGKFWETQAKYAFFIETQPEATAPAQDLSAAILALPLPTPSWARDHHGENEVYIAQDLRNLLKAAAALASSANALSARDRVDAERYRALRARVGSDHKHHTQRSIEVIVSDWGRSFGRTDINAGVWSMSTIDGDELDAAIDAAILQSQKAK